MGGCCEERGFLCSVDWEDLWEEDLRVGCKICTLGFVVGRMIEAVPLPFSLPSFFLVSVFISFFGCGKK